MDNLNKYQSYDNNTLHSGDWFYPTVEEYWYPTVEPWSYPVEPYRYPTINTTYKFIYTPAISPITTKYERKDLPVAEIQVKGEIYPIVIKKVKNIFLKDGFIKVIYKEGRAKRSMMFIKENVVAIHKTGW